jgi:hypothetical protein
LSPNAAGRDPIVTRILWLRGLEKCNAWAFARNIYIDGTPVERLMGCPASYGCIQMGSHDVTNLFASISVETKIAILNAHLRAAIAQAASIETVRLATNRPSLR